MSEKSPREWRFFIDDMVRFAKNVREYTSDVDQSGFSDNQMIYDATVRNLELIGEAASHIPEDVRAKYPQIQWRKIIATRNRLIHGYLGIDNDTLWSIIKDDIPGLISELEQLQKDLQ